jgi:uncharacterized protein YraI
MFRKLTSIILFALLLVTSVVALNAQSVATLDNGTPALIRLSAEAPINILTFSGNAGDLVQVDIIGLSPQLNPRVSLQSPTQQPLTSSALNAGGNSASLSYRLSESGAHSLLIGGEAGDYVVSHTIIDTSNAYNFSYGINQEVTLGTDELQVASILIPADGRATVSISAGQFRDYVVSAFDESGKHIATLSNTSYACLVVAPQSTLVFARTHIDVQGSVIVNVGADCGSGSSSGSQSAPSSQSGTIPTAPQTGSSACVVTNGGAVNVRSDAGTNYNVIGQLSAGSTTPVTARHNSEWVQIQSPFGYGFVSTTVVTLSGNCDNLPPTSALIGPTVAATNVPNVQPTQEQPVQPQPTTQAPVQPTDAPTEQPTEAPTEAPVQPTEAPTQQVAPDDGNHSANINLDGAIVVSDYVSYPNGDTEDTIFYRVDGLNNSVALPGGQATYTVVLTCSGNGTQYIQMEMQGSTYGCGQVATRIVNADSNNGVIRIRATGGSDTYVQWTLNVTAPRVN